jgi:hypothetical protein
LASWSWSLLALFVFLLLGGRRRHVSLSLLPSGRRRGGLGGSSPSSSSSFWLVVFVLLWRCRLPFLGCRWRLVASPSSPLLSSIDIILH